MVERLVRQEIELPNTELKARESFKDFLIRFQSKHFDFSKSQENVVLPSVVAESWGSRGYEGPNRLGIEEALR